jgi:hypothetical protein
VGRLAVAALSLALLLTSPAGAASERPLLGLLEGRESATLVRVDSRTLRALPAGARRLGPVASWSFSPGLSRLVVATVGRPGVCPRSSLRFFDARTLRPSGELALGSGGVEALAWLRNDRLLAVRYTCGSGAFSLAVVDPVRGEVLESESIDGEIVRFVPTTTRVVALVAARGSIAPARLLVIDVNGVVRARTLDAISAGAQHGPGDVERYQRPGLAVADDRAFVVTTGLTAEIDLERLGVAYHSQRTLSAAAKASEGWSRQALWLGDGRIVVSGKDEETFTTAGDVLNVRDRPAGLTEIDTRSWKVRVIDSEADWFVRVDRLVYVGRNSWDSSTQRMTVMGVAAYDVEGNQRFHVVPGSPAHLALEYRGRAYVGLDPRGGRYVVIDVESGRVVGTRRGRLPRVLLEQSSPFWGNGY